MFRCAREQVGKLFTSSRAAIPHARLRGWYHLHRTAGKRKGLASASNQVWLDQSLHGMYIQQSTPVKGSKNRGIPLVCDGRNML